MRREIRQLTDTDREAFFDAMETLYRLPTSEGNALFGDGYKVCGEESVRACVLPQKSIGVGSNCDASGNS